MKKFYVILWIILTVSMIHTEESNEVSALEYFKDLRVKMLARLPDAFTAELSAISISNKLASIPKDSYIDKNKNCTVQLSYTKKSGISIEVKNVDDLYRDLYKDLPKQIFALDLILSSENNNAFLSKYNISYVSKTKELIILQLSITAAENSLYLQVLPDRALIQRVDYKIGKELLSSTALAFKEFPSKINTNKYFIPNIFISKIFQGSRDSRPDIVELKNIEIK